MSRCDSRDNAPHCPCPLRSSEAFIAHSTAADLAAKIRRREADDLLERLREMKHVAEAEFLGEFLQSIGPLVNRRAGTIDALASLKMSGRRAGARGKLLAKVVVTQSHLARDLLRR